LPSQSGATNDPTGGAPIVECTGFGSGFTWGPIKRADVTIGGKTAGNLPIQVISDSSYAVPSDCWSHWVNNLGTVSMLGANGVVGISPARSDWPAAAQTALSATYYYCTSATSCTNTRVPLDTQVMNPVANFTSDNNGTIIRLPAVPATGKPNVTGELVFGIGTQQNNALPSSANILALDQNGYLTTTYKGRSYSSAIDSGSTTNMLWDTTIPYAGDDNRGYLYAPPSTLSLSAILNGAVKNSVPVTVPFSLANGWTLIANQNAAYDSLATPFSGMFIWGLPFFFGRDVFTALNGSRAGTQTGPFVAF
jgi:hypothetical protein